MEKIVDAKFFGNFKKKFQKQPTQDLSNIERNKVMKNQPIRGIPRGLAYNKQPGGVDLTPPCRIGLSSFLSGVSAHDSGLSGLASAFTEIKMGWFVLTYAI